MVRSLHQSISSGNDDNSGNDDDKDGNEYDDENPIRIPFEDNPGAGTEEITKPEEEEPNQDNDNDGNLNGGASE